MQHTEAAICKVDECDIYLVRLLEKKVWKWWKCRPNTLIFTKMNLLIYIIKIYDWSSEQFSANICFDEHILKRSWRLLLSSSSEDALQDVSIKTNIFVLAIHLQDVLQKRFRDIFKTSPRRFKGVFKTSSKHLQDVLQRLLQDDFKAS